MFVFFLNKLYLARNAASDVSEIFFMFLFTVKDKEEGRVDSEARPMKDETFGEYRSGGFFTASQESGNVGTVISLLP